MVQNTFWRTVRSFEYVQWFKTTSSLTKVILELNSHTSSIHTHGIISEFNLKSHRIASHVYNFILTIDRSITLQIVTDTEGCVFLIESSRCYSHQHQTILAEIFFFLKIWAMKITDVSSLYLMLYKIVTMHVLIAGFNANTDPQTFSFKIAIKLNEIKSIKNWKVIQIILTFIIKNLQKK